MPIANSFMKEPDPFIMEEDSVNQCVAVFLEKREFTITSLLNGRERGIDVAGEKSGWKICVESKGSAGNHHIGTDTVFTSNQMFDHLCKQVIQLIQLKNKEDKNTIYVMANPDIPRIRTRVAMINDTLNEIQFVKFWVQENEDILVDYPISMEDLLKSLWII